MTANAERPRLRRGSDAAWPVDVLALLAAIALGLPVVALVARAFLDGSLSRVVGARVVVDALTLSLVTTIASLVLTVAIGIPLAVVLARRSFRGSTILEAAIDLPIVLPPSVAGLALLLLLGRRGLVGEPLHALGIEVPFTTAAVVLAQTFVSAPFFIRSARTGFGAVDHDLEDAARVDGASERHVFLAVTVPLAASALAAGLVMSWARSLGEFGATIMFAGSLQRVTQTLPLAIYAEFEQSFDVALAIGALLVAFSFTLLLAVKWLRSDWISASRFATSTSA